DVLPVDPIGAALRLAAHHDVAVGVEGIAAIDLHPAGQYSFQEAECREDMRHVAVDRDAVAFAAQRIAALVHARAPAALGERDGGDETAETCPDDLSMAGPHDHPLELLPARLLLRIGQIANAQLIERAVGEVRNEAIALELLPRLLDLLRPAEAFHAD